MQEAIRCCTEDVCHTHGIEVQIRVGLNSGEIVVRAVGGELHMGYTAVGQTIHFVEHMQQVAKPGSILMTPEVRWLAAGSVPVTSRPWLLTALTNGCVTSVWILSLRFRITASESFI